MDRNSLQHPPLWLNLITIAMMFIGLIFSSFWLVAISGTIGLILSIPVLFEFIQKELLAALSIEQQAQLMAIITLIIIVTSSLRLKKWVCLIVHI